MSISKDVIEDLLPLYFENELSDDSRKLVEDFFEENPDYAKEKKHEYSTNLPTRAPSQDNIENKLEVLNHTQKLLKFRSVSLNTGIFCTLFPIFYFTFFNFEGRSFTGFSWMLGDIGGICLFIALIAWSAYFFIRYKMRTTKV